MTLIGLKSDFAIQFELDAQFCGEWLFGKICYFVNDCDLTP